MDQEGNAPFATAKRLKTGNGYIVLPNSEPSIGDTVVVDSVLGFNIYGSKYAAGGGTSSGGISDSTKALETNTATPVTINATAPPTIGQTLVATGGSNATWQTLVPGTASSSNVTKALATLAGPGNDVKINTSNCAGSGLVLVSTSATDAKWSSVVPQSTLADTSTVAYSLATSPTGSVNTTATAPTAGQILTASSGSVATWQTPAVPPLADAASALKTTGANVVVSTSAPPAAQQVLSAITGGTSAAWVDVTAKNLWSTSSPTTNVSLTSAILPTTGQVLTATSTTSAAWATLPTPPTATTANALNTTSVGNPVVVNTAAPPTVGSVLTATSATAANWAIPGSGSSLYGQLVQTTGGFNFTTAITDPNAPTLGNTLPFAFNILRAINGINTIEGAAPFTGFSILQTAFYQGTFDISLTPPTNTEITFYVYYVVGGVFQTPPLRFTTSDNTQSFSSSFTTISSLSVPTGTAVSLRIGSGTVQNVTNVTRVAATINGLVTGLQGPTGPAGPAGSAGVMYESMPLGLQEANRIITVTNTKWACSWLANGSASVNKVDILFWANDNTSNTFDLAIYDATGANKLASIVPVSTPTVISNAFTVVTFNLTTLLSLAVNNRYWLAFSRYNSITGTSQVYGQATTATNDAFFNRTSTLTTPPELLPASIAGWGASANRFYFRIYS